MSEDGSEGVEFIIEGKAASPLSSFGRSLGVPNDILKGEIGEKCCG